MPRMCSPQELLRDSRRKLLSRSPRSSSPLERSEPIALMERGRTCGLFFRPLRNRPRSNRPRRNSHSLRQPPSPRTTARTLPPPQQPPSPPRKARIHPSCCDCFTAAPGKNRAACILFSTNARNKPSSWQCLPEMYAFRDRNGKILALCVHFQVQSGGFGYMA